ncbi:hypothetical protein BDR03DRAFT_953274 [Suillus americanus]|nr:hypothetical protein BDR03DRAFT_953274 [Suillus americanus]
MRNVADWQSSRWFANEICTLVVCTLLTQPLLVLVGGTGVCSSRFDPEFPRIPSVGY